MTDRERPSWKMEGISEGDEVQMLRRVERSLSSEASLQGSQIINPAKLNRSSKRSFIDHIVEYEEVSEGDYEIISHQLTDHSQVPITPHPNSQIVLRNSHLFAIISNPHTWSLHWQGVS